MKSTGDLADELTALAVSVIRSAIKLTVLVLDTGSRWVGALLIRSFRNYYPTKSLLVWLVLSLVAISCAVLVVAVTHSLLGWLTLFGLVGVSLLSLTILDLVLAGLANQGPQQQELDHGHAWGPEEKQ